tara:strand:+ start:480 stop:767 length:288 start_codon:yes stop_codon:yes gene_type:complete
MTTLETSTTTPLWAIALAQQNLSDPINWTASRDPITSCINPKASGFAINLMRSNRTTERKLLRKELNSGRWGEFRPTQYWKAYSAGCGKSSKEDR